MREIKFRGYSLEDNQWHYGSLIHTIKGYFVMPIEDGDLYPVEEASIGQYTGLKDMNGKEIYEGDKIANDDFEYGRVKYDEKFAAWDFDGYCGKYVNSGKWEVVGNTYEEKLKKE